MPRTGAAYDSSASAGISALRALAVFEPAWFTGTHELVATLWRTGVQAVAEIGCLAQEGRANATDVTSGVQPPQVEQFGVHWVALGAAGPEAFRRLAVGYQRLAVAVATDDVACLERSLRTHPMFRAAPVTLLRP